MLLDVTGVLYESGEGGGTVIKGSPEAVEKYVSKFALSNIWSDFLGSRLRQAGVKLKFCTNETLTTRRVLVEKLQRHGFSLREDEVHSPAPACLQFLNERNLRPFLIGMAY